jgi:hypothetical protein
MIDEPIHHCRSALAGKIHIPSLAADIIRVSLYAHLPARIVVQLSGHVRENRLSFGWNRRFIRGEVNFALAQQNPPAGLAEGFRADVRWDISSAGVTVQESDAVPRFLSVFSLSWLVRHLLL